MIELILSEFERASSPSYCLVRMSVLWRHFMPRETNFINSPGVPRERQHIRTRTSKHIAPDRCKEDTGGAVKPPP